MCFFFLGFMACDDERQDLLKHQHQQHDKKASARPPALAADRHPGGLGLLPPPTPGTPSSHRPPTPVNWPDRVWGDFHFVHLFIHFLVRYDTHVHFAHPCSGGPGMNIHCLGKQTQSGFGLDVRNQTSISGLGSKRI